MVSRHDNGEPRWGTLVCILEATSVLALIWERHRNYGSRPPLPVSRIEFLQDANDRISHIVSFYANVKFFQKRKCPAVEWRAKPRLIVNAVSKSPPSTPRTEHPIAYKGKKVFMVKFLEPHEFTLHMGPASVGAPARLEHPSPTPIALGSPAIQPMPNTSASLSAVRGALTVGSPSMPIHGSRVRMDTPYPMYEFKLVEGMYAPFS